MTGMPTRRLGASDADWAHLTPKNIVDLGVDASQPDAKTRMRWVMYQGREDLGPILAVEQEIRGEWHSTGGSWYLETLVSGDRWSRPATGDIIPIDFGAKWYAYNLQDALVAATHRLKVSTSGLGGLGAAPRVLLEKRTGNYHLTLVTTGEDEYQIGVTYTGDWGSGSPVIIDLDTPEEDILWAWEHQLRGDHDVEALLVTAGYDQHTNERTRSFNGT